MKDCMVNDQPQGASPHTHDYLAKLYLGEPILFGDFLVNYGDPLLISRLNLRKLRREPADAVSGKLTERLGDLRYRCEFLGGRLPLEAFVFLEHQSTPQRHIPLRILGYLFDAYTNLLAQLKKGALLPYPLAIVLYHGKMPWKGPLTMRELIGVPKGLNPFILDYPLLLVDVARMDPDRLKGSPVLRALLAALGASAHGDFEQRFPMIMENLATSEKNPLLRDRMDAMTHYAITRCHTRSSYRVVSSAYEQAFGMKEGNKMAKSLLEQLLDQGRAEGMEMTKTLRDQLVEKGRAEGMEMAKTLRDQLVEKGRAEGMEKGRVEGMEIVAIKILSSRFDKVPASLEKMLKQVTDLEDLQRLAVLAATCESLAEFKRAAAEIKAGSKK